MELTKEEFLDKKNTKIHREILEAFKSKEINSQLSRYTIQSSQEHPSLFCSIQQSNLGQIKVTHYYQHVFINIVEAMKRGDLIINTAKK